MTTSACEIRGCHVMAKPSSSVCNLDCEYCFYLEKENLYLERKSRWRMSDETLEEYIKQYIDAQDTENVSFMWQGGEPTLMGLDFYRKVVELQHRYQGNKIITNAFQTNAILIDDEWCQFFKQHDFLIGVSLDGPADIHDKYRVSRAGKATHAKVMEAILLLRKHRVEFNTLTVVSDEVAKYPQRVYEFLKSAGSTYLQFIPLVERRAKNSTAEGLELIAPEFDYAADVTSWSVGSKQYGEFLNQIFDIWVQKDVGRIFVNMFDSTLASWCRYPAGSCVFSPTCGHAFALEANGDLYHCDHYVYPEYKIGNIHHQAIREMNNSHKVIQFGDAKRDKLTRQCRSCDYHFACYGGCPKHRFITSQTGEPLHNYFCEGYQCFFKHTEPYMKLMRDLLMQGRPATEIMRFLGTEKGIRYGIKIHKPV